MSKIHLTISKNLKLPDYKDAKAWYIFDEESFDKICQVLDEIQDQEAKKHWEEEKK